MIEHIWLSSKIIYMQHMTHMLTHFICLYRSLCTYMYMTHIYEYQVYDTHIWDTFPMRCEESADALAWAVRWAWRPQDRKEGQEYGRSSSSPTWQIKCWGSATCGETHQKQQQGEEIKRQRACNCEGACWRKFLPSQEPEVNVTLSKHWANV